MNIILAVSAIIVSVIIYFAGVSRGTYNEKQKRIRTIVDRYHEEIVINSHLAEYLYPKLLLNAGILSLDSERDIKKVLKMIEQMHIKSPFATYKSEDIQDTRRFLINFQKDER